MRAHRRVSHCGAGLCTSSLLNLRHTSLCCFLGHCCLSVATPCQILVVKRFIRTSFLSFVDWSDCSPAEGSLPPPTDPKTRPWLISHSGPQGEVGAGSLEGATALPLPQTR
ncbi:unnamed protein product [Rangifer tarandus platyrhynchus]|uniref:Uncharacterized protein n=2 Tax=Rangifer tarandus platyrhynchus TaxID=3082113 RepID=A0AC59YCP7_RANTA|nr:unnamed protein product [Rangifer tarandus platyrhynchus]